jgi:nucleoside-diphosphate-sugar epimerase
MDNLNKDFPFSRVLITGGGGYLGSKLAEHLSATSADIFLVDLYFNAVAQKLAENNPKIKLIQADLTDKSLLKDACQSINPDVIYHFAAAIDRSRDFTIYEKLYKSNVQGTLNLLEVLSKVPYKGFFFASTSEVYGVNNPVPFHEEMLPEAASPYSLTKLQAEELIRTWSAIHNKPWTIFRIFNFFGAGMPENTFIPQLIQACINHETFHMSHGEQKRDYLEVNELISCITTLAGNDKAQKEIINLCSGTSHSMNELAGHFIQLSGNTLDITFDLPYRENELWDNTGSNSKLLALNPGFSPVSLFEGLQNPYSR